MSYGKMNGILLQSNSLKFPLVKVIVSKIAYKSLKTTKNSHFLRTDHRNVRPWKFFQRSRGYNMYQKLVQTDQGYQSHQLLSDLDSYRRRYWSFFKTACNPHVLKSREFNATTHLSFENIEFFLWWTLPWSFFFSVQMFYAKGTFRVLSLHLWHI